MDNLLVTRHESCMCGHCRCEHQLGYAECAAKDCDCGRYTWPGRNADLPANHNKAEPRPLASILDKPHHLITRETVYAVINSARNAGLVIDDGDGTGDGSVLDLLADNIPAPLPALRRYLRECGLADEFPMSSEV